MKMTTNTTRRSTLVLLICSLAAACGTEQAPTEPADWTTIQRGVQWGPQDNPASLDDGFEYTFSSLPTEGEAADVPWVGTYWPTYRDSINYAWDGEGTDSPTVKFAEAFGRTGLEERISDAYGIQSVAQKYSAEACTEDTECDEDKAEVCAKRAGATDGFCVPTWWGICHAWAPAAIMEKEPKKEVTHNGVTFKVNDLKALLTLSYTAGLSVDFISLRCNKSNTAAEITYGDYGIPISDDAECADTNAGTFHVLATNLLGIQKRSFVEDRTFDVEVWNQPVRSYKLTKNVAITPAQANGLLGVDASETAYLFNDAAVSFRHIKMTFKYMGESPQHVDGNLAATSHLYTYTDHYSYVLELDGAGKIIGGEWVGASQQAHPDFIWYGTAKKSVEIAKDAFKPGTGISWADVQTLLEKSLEPDAPEPTEPDEPGGFDWGDGCVAGEGSFEQEIEKSAKVDIGEIPSGQAGIRIELTSDADVDVQLIDKETGHEIIAWPSGDLNGSGEACTTYEDTEYCYSGYNGDGTNLGHEWIEIKGTSNRPLLMKAYGYKAGNAVVDYQWDASEDCVDAGSGSFSQDIPKGSTIDVGVIPAGKKNIKVTLTSPEDVDIQLFDGNTPIVMWPSGILSGPSAQSTQYKGMTVHYSGYNGDGTNYGHEYIMVEGTVSVDLKMKAYGYKAGAAQVDYFWGLTDAEVSGD